MTLQFSNKHIFFAIESIWQTLDYKFKNILHQAVTANPDDDFIQSLEVSEDILLQIYETVATLPEGLATNINDDMKEELTSQLMAQANFAEMQDPEDPQPPNEAARALMRIQAVRDIYEETLDAKVLRGKNMILQ